jgi:hypothetical protein
MKLPSIILLFAFIGLKAFSQSKLDTETSKAETFFKTASVITFNEDYNPRDYIGSIIYYKKGDQANIRVLKITKPNDSTVIQQSIDDILYQKMHTREDVLNVKYLGIFSSKIEQKNLLEVILLRDYSLETQSFLIDSTLYNKVMKNAVRLKKAGYEVEFVWKVNVNKLTSRVFKQGEIQVGFNYQAEGKGGNYNKTEDFTKKNLITLQTIDISVFIDQDKSKANLKFITFKPMNTDILNPILDSDYIVAQKITIEQ